MNTNKSSIQRNQGFSLAGVLVAAAIVGFLSLAVMKIIENGQKGQQSIQHSSEFNILRSNIQKVIDSPLLCDSAFRQNASNPAVFTDSLGTPQDIGLIRLGSATTAPVLAQIGMDIGSGMKITKLQFQQLAPVDLSVPGKKIYHAALFIEAKKNQAGYGGSVLSNKQSPFLVTVSTNGLNQIDGCRPSNALPTCAAGQTLQADASGAFRCVNNFVCRIAVQGTGNCAVQSGSGWWGKACSSHATCQADEKAISGGITCPNGILQSSKPTSSGWEGTCWAQAGSVHVGRPNLMEAHSWVQCCKK